MSMITKITTYNAPFEIGSADRFYEDIDNKLQNYLVLDAPKFSYSLTNSTTMSLTVTDEGQRASYVRVEGDIFPDKPVSYWFLTAVSRVESKRANQFSATLDVMATYGEAIFDILDGQKIKIDRLHEDRYIFDGTNFTMNTKHHGLINSDFKLGDTKGVQLNFDGADEEKSTGPTTMYVSDGIWRSGVGGDGESGIQFEKGTDDIPGNSPDYTYKSKKIIVNNNLKIADKEYYIYALIQLKGKPTIYQNAKPISDKLGFSSDNIYRDKYGLRDTLVVPISVEDYYEIHVGHNTQINKLSIIEELQQEKVLNIIKIPYKLEYSNLYRGVQDETCIELLFNTADGRIRKEISSSVNTDNILYKEDGTKVDNTKSYINYNYELGADFTDYQIYQLFVMNTIKSFNDADILQIPTSKLSDDDIMGFIARTKTANEMKAIVDADETEKLEIALLNSDIMPIDLHIHDLVKTIDIPNFYNQADITKIEGTYTINELGIETSLQLSPNQFVEWSENTIMSFATDQGATYLARNKYTQDAQRKGIDIQRDISVAQARSQEGQSGANASNILGAMMSLGASIAGGAVGASYASQEAGLQKDLAKNKKAQIQASIDDASATSPSLHTGSVHNLSNLNTQEFRYNFNWVMKIPNEAIRNKIVDYYDRHGYTFHDWIIFDKDMVVNRKKFNYIQIDEFKDYIATFKNFDINMLNLVDAEFKKGLRLWHQDLIIYNDPNIEIVIEEAINQLQILNNDIKGNKNK